MKVSDKAIIALSALGLAVTAYLILYHYSAVQLYCPNESTVINCTRVLNSSYSVVFGVPLPILGFVFFALELLVFFRIKTKEQLIFLNAIGIATVMFLIYLEYVLGSICAWCTVVHALVVALFIISIYREK
ncbi:MAG: vitamin K epoxide reductase family protein [Candidatus Micrarchaeota archaeon]|nr:vitamin K epoxide reductase family protein [Candidatus Micrarchaeota archaeon]